ncbi:MAG: SDR family NAD(P)-dependent oxidoreductase [Anaerolineales bacterium]|jgi:NAD(P)-dependent dehydrogenase (short-subunit alcohol dehydrogenase family)
MRGLEGKRVVITGGASGIGAATAQRFIEEGSRVAVVDWNQDSCQKIKAELPGLELVLNADISDVQQVKNAYAQIDQAWGGLDVLINNAGISIRHNFLDITPEEWIKIQSINLNGTFYMAQAAAKRMLEHGGVILNMGSTNALAGNPYYTDYNASKAGVIEMTKTMALELAPKIRVNVICPGYVMTPMQKAEYTEEMFAALNEKLPLKRHADPNEVAALFAFLASDDAAYLTGGVYVIDGGETAGALASR